MCLTKAAAATEDSARLAAKVFQYSSNLLSQRCLSFSRYSCPPVSYCHVLSEPALAQVSVRQFKQDLDLIHVAEKSREGKAQELAADMRLTFTTLVRVCALTFEQDKWSAESRQGRFFLRQLLRSFADNKIVEDCHQSIRVDAKANANCRQRPSSIQSIVTNCQALEQRDIPDVFCQKWKNIPLDGSLKKMFLPRKHKMHKLFGKIMGVRSWPALSENSLARSAAAWCWARSYFGEGLVRQGQVQLKDWGSSQLVSMSTKGWCVVCSWQFDS